MSGPTWMGDAPPPPEPISLAGWLRVAWRGALILAGILTGAVLMMALRVVERPLRGEDRPWSPFITQVVSRWTMIVMGISLTARGPRLRGPGAVVANHSSWLDIFVLNSRKNVYFVSKAEVGAWPFIGWVARLVGTVFIARDPRQAGAQRILFRQRLLHGHRLLFFPEGTSTDGLRVLPFKSTLFAAFFDDALRHELQIQPVTVIYHAPEGADPSYYGWWGEMDFGAHLLKVLATRQQGSVELVYHPPVRVDAFPNRKSLAAHAEALVRQAHGPDILRASH